MPVRPASLLVACAGVVALAACSGKPPPPCSPVYVLGDANRLTAFGPGAGREAANVDFSVEFQGYKGKCGYRDQKDSEMELSLAFTVTRGPANTTGVADFSYFVAIPRFYPSNSAKAIFPVRVEFPEGMDRMRYDDASVSLLIPLKPGEDVGAYDVYIGLQGTPEQLEFNRSHKE